MTKADLQQAGFTDIEINSYFDDQKKSLSDAGFSQQEIDTHYGTQTAVLENPDEAYKKGVEVLDLSVNLQLPVDTIESNYNAIMEIADPKDISIHEVIQAPYTEMRFEATPPKTNWQKVKGFFTSGRDPLPPNASRMEKVDRALHIAADAPLRTFLKFAGGLTFGADEIMWAGIKRITPDDMWVDEVKNMTLEEAMDWAAGYNPSGFVKMSGEVAGFVGKLRTAKGIGVRTGLLGKTPKDISVLQKASEAAKLFGIAASAEQVSKAVATKIDPSETEYGYEGPKAVLRDMAIGAILSVASSGIGALWSKLTPTETSRALKLLGLKKGATPDEITSAARKMALQYHPDKAKGFVKEFQEVIKARNLLRQGEPQDIVFRGQKIKISPKLLPGAVSKAPEAIVKPVTAPAKAPTAAPVAKPSAKPTDIAPKAAEAKPEGEVTVADVEKLELPQDAVIKTETLKATVASPEGAPFPVEAQPERNRIRVESDILGTPQAAKQRGTLESKGFIKLSKQNVWVGPEKPTPTAKPTEAVEGIVAVSGVKTTPPKQGGTVEEFESLGNLQRGKPENAMLKATSFHSGVLGWLLEHVGDLTHRMTENLSGTTGTLTGDGGFGASKPKIERAFKFLTEDDFAERGVRQAHEENIVNNAELSKLSETEYRAELERLGNIYSAEHAKLPVFNEVQQRARDAAIALGKQDFATATEHITWLKNLIDQGEDAWNKAALEGISQPTPTAKPAAIPKKAEPGFLDVEPLQKTFDAVLNILEPAKKTDISLGKDVSATVIRGIHKPDVAMIEFNEKTIDNLDGTLKEFGEKLAKFSNKTLENLMLSRGKPATKEAIAIRNEALAALKKDAPELIGTRDMITKIADFNYKFLTDVVGDKIEYVTDYFYGIYKDSKKVDRFLGFWKTTKRFTKEKKLPTVADAKAYGLDLRDPNPVNNLRSEYMAIARLDGMIWMRDELMRTGKDSYISDNPAIIKDAEKIPEPVFKGLWFDPVLAKEIKSLISSNKIAQVPALNSLRKTNNFLRSIKFLFSAFHHGVIAKQAAADSGFLGFLYKPTALRGFSIGFRKNDPRFKTAEYKNYIEHGGGHRFSIDSEAQRAFTAIVNKLSKSSQLAIRIGTLPLRIPEGYVKWLFESYIPEIKYAKYLDFVNEKQKKLGRELTSAEKIDIIKEGQNFYGMMNEQLFGRSGTVTTVLRLKFMAPGFAEGNYRTILKAVSQWGQEGTWNAGRSRANIVNSLLLTVIAATAGTLAFTGKPPKKPKTAADFRDLFKIDTGMTDDKGRKIMIDMMTYDKDYWTVFGKPLVGQAAEVPGEVVRRLGGMTATTFEVISDLNQLSMGNALYDWKGDRVVEITDPFLIRAASLIAHEAQKVEPIATNIYRQTRDKGLDRFAAAITTLAGLRPTTSEKDKRESEIISRIFSLRDRQERLFHYLGSIKNPRKHINRYNAIAQGVLDNPVTTQDMKNKWGDNLVIDVDRLMANKVHSHELLRVSDKPKPDKLERNKKWLTNFDIPENEFRKHLVVYEMKHRTLILEMKKGDADEMLKQEIARFYADKGILNRKVKDDSATDREKRESRRFNKIADGISTIGARINKTVRTADRKRLYERVKSLIERSIE